MQERSDAQLLRDYAVEGSEEAFGRLVSRHAALVYAAARRQCESAETAREVSQQVFTDLARKAPVLSRQLAPAASIAGWLYRSTRFAVLNVLRTERRRRSHERVVMQQQDSLPDSTTTKREWDSIAPLLDEAMAELRAQDREAVLLRFFQHCDFATVGNALGVSADAAQKRVSRALERLRVRLAKRGVVVGGGALALALTNHATAGAPAGWAGAVTGAALQMAAAEPATLASGWLKALLWAKSHTAVTSVAGALILAGAVGVSISQQHSASAHARLPAGTNAAALSMGGSHGIVLASDGSLWSWGTNFLGWSVLGLGSVEFQPTLHQIGAGNDWIGIASSRTHCLALKSDGTIWGWGQNIYGQLGGGRGRANADRSEPVPTIWGEDWRQIAAGGSHSLGIKADGTLWSWGNNWAGQVGIGSTNREVRESTLVNSNTNWIRIWASGVQSVALQSDGSLWFWGSLTGSADDTNQMRVPTPVSPDTNWAEVGFGYFNAFAIKTDGTLWAWGRDAWIYTGGPKQLVNATPSRVGRDFDWKAISTSEGFYHLLQKTDGSLWAMDARDYMFINKSNYRPVEFKQIPIPGKVVSFDAAGQTGAALTEAGELWTWGEVFGESTRAYPRLNSLAQAIGWKTERFKGQRLVREKPWRLGVQ